MDILVARTRLDCAYALENIDAIAEAMVAAKAAPGHAQCLCTSPARKLVVRTVGKRHFLAVWPHDGHHHHFACPFYRAEVDAGGAGSQVEPAVRETEDGFDVAADFPLSRILKRQPPDPAAQSTALHAPAYRTQRSRMGLLGLLQHLWTVGGLNRWGRGWKRDWWRVTQELIGVIEQGSLGAKPMMEQLYLVPEFSLKRKDLIDQAWDDFKSRLVPSEEQVRMGLVVGEIKDFGSSSFGYKTTLRHFPTPLYLKQELRQKLSESYPRAFHKLNASLDQRNIGIFLVELAPKGYLNVIDGALMACSLQYIPVDSSYEAQVAHKLVDEGRAFSKPLRLEVDASSLPDFVLTDTNPPCVMEVYGMTSSEYLERKAQKQARYREEGKPVWAWDAAVDKHMPRFPERALMGTPSL
jgi:hypothetical protein